MRFTYSGPLVGNVEVPALGLVFVPGEDVEVTGPAAQQLLRSPEFTRTDEPKTRDDGSDEDVDDEDVSDAAEPGSLPDPE